MGYASAIALVVFAVILVATLVQFRIRGRWVHEE
jgi:multiple sugar transport system permease protein